MDSLEGKPTRESRVTLTQLMGPGDANAMGNVHGGVIMKLCDEAGGMAAIRHARRPAVTVVVDSMAFHSPVQIGNLLTVSAEVTWTGRSSMETRVLVNAEDILTGECTHTNTAYFVYVAIGEDGRPCPVPPLILESDEERQRYDSAAERQAYRLQQRRQGLL